MITTATLNADFLLTVLEILLQAMWWFFDAMYELCNYFTSPRNVSYSSSMYYSIIGFIKTLMLDFSNIFHTVEPLFYRLKEQTSEVSLNNCFKTYHNEQSIFLIMGVKQINTFPTTF